jgi:hypothetical protein
MDHSDQVDWVAVGCLARRLQHQAIDLNRTAAVAPAHDPDFDAPGRARATVNDLVEGSVRSTVDLRAGSDT